MTKKQTKKFNKEQINRIKKLAEVRMKKYPQWRKGQAIFNVAFELYPYLADQLRGTIHDCFHRDDLIDEFLNALERLEDEKVQ